MDVLEKSVHTLGVNSAEAITGGWVGWGGGAAQTLKKQFLND